MKQRIWKVFGKDNVEKDNVLPSGKCIAKKEDKKKGNEEKIDEYPDNRSYAFVYVKITPEILQKRKDRVKSIDIEKV